MLGGKVYRGRHVLRPLSWARTTLLDQNQHKHKHNHQRRMFAVVCQWREWLRRRPRNLARGVLSMLLHTMRPALMNSTAWEGCTMGSALMTLLAMRDALAGRTVFVKSQFLVERTE